ncbi:MAG: sugar-binding transcriptional regulator [Chloroflexi bacterium]|nr:sugar-binding transcriptional regulator [Chloroflexota bacterium]
MSELNEERARLLVRVASLYYEQGLTQKEVAQRIGLSRSNVSRLLTEAHRQGIVEIRINHPWATSSELAATLIRRFGLQDALVLASGSPDRNEVLRGMGVLAARYLERILKPNSILGIGWGTALYEVVHELRHTRIPGIEVVQIIGGTGSLNPQIDGTELARQLARALGARYRYLHAPLIVETAELCRALMQDRNIHESLEVGRKADVALVGIGAVVREISSLTRSGHLRENELSWLQAIGAVGDICAQHFDIHGRICAPELNSRVVGLRLDELQRIPCVIGVAGWREKAPAILGALRGKYVDVLVTDDAAAQEVLRLAGE